MTKGIDSSKADLEFNRDHLAYLTRGFVIAYPMVRGTNYFDYDWKLAGSAAKKLTHLSDMIDCALFVRDKDLTQRLGIKGIGPSGGFTALSVLF